MNIRLKSEIDAIAKSSADGLLHAENVLAFARDHPDSALHETFNWDDTEAANMYRLQQARSLIRVYIKYLPSVQREVRAYVSVPSDRANGGGYRDTGKVVDNPLLLNDVLLDAIKQTRKLRERFEYIAALRPFFDRIDALADEYEKALMEKAQAG